MMSTLERLTKARPAATATTVDVPCRACGSALMLRVADARSTADGVIDAQCAEHHGRYERIGTKRQNIEPLNH